MPSTCMYNCNSQAIEHFSEDSKLGQESGWLKLWTEKEWIIRLDQIDFVRTVAGYSFH